jgi:hypothetical protein
MFIRTNGGDNIKLSLVEVDIYDAKVIEADIEKKQDRAKPILDAFAPIQDELGAAAKTADDAASHASDAEIAAIGTDGADKASADSTAARAVADKADAANEQLLNESGYLVSTIYYFADLPQPLQSTKTDADGKFEFDVPPGSYVLVAQSSRKAGADVVGDDVIPTTEFYNWMVKVDVDSDKTVMLANDNLSSTESTDSLVHTPDNELGIYSAMDGKSIETLEAMVSQLKEHTRQVEMATYEQDPGLAQKKAVELYPDLGVAGSELNKEFISRMKRYKVEKQDFFSEPDWPIRLAKECSDDLAAKQSGTNGGVSGSPSP